MDVFTLSELLSQQDKPYQEFIRTSTKSLSVGIYQLPAGGVDPQKPHTEDEVYYVVSGQATICISEQDYPVKDGSIIFVKAGDEHRLHTIKENLTMLVFFAPAEYTNSVKGR